MKIELNIQQQIDLLRAIYEAIINETYESIELVHQSVLRANIRLIHHSTNKKLDIGICKPYRNVFWNRKVVVKLDEHDYSFFVKRAWTGRRKELYEIYELVLRAINQRHTEHVDSFRFEVAQFATDSSIFDLLNAELTQIEVSTAQE